MVMKDNDNCERLYVVKWLEQFTYGKSGKAEAAEGKDGLYLS